MTYSLLCVSVFYCIGNALPSVSKKIASAHPCVQAVCTQPCARAVYQILSIQLPPCALILSFVGLTVNFPLENAFCEVQIDEMYCLASV